MRLIATIPLRNEAWVAGLSLRAALMWVDSIVALNHASTDGTRDILEDISKEYPGRIRWIDVGEDSWHEMQHRQRLLDMAREDQATHIAIVDADEILCGNLLGSIREIVEQSPAWNILQLPIYNMRGTIDRYHLTGIWGNRTVSVAFENRPAFNWSGDQFHHREPFGVPEFAHRPLSQGSGGVMHLWGVTERRLIAKHAMYKVSERLRWPDKPVAKIDAYYNWAVRESASVLQYGEWKFAATPTEWLSLYAHLMKHFNPEMEPWQEKPVQELYQQYGPEMFRGLDLFGVV